MPISYDKILEKLNAVKDRGENTTMYMDGNKVLISNIKYDSETDTLSIETIPDDKRVHPYITFDPKKLIVDGRTINGKYLRNDRNDESVFESVFAPNGELYFIREFDNVQYTQYASMFDKVYGENLSEYYYETGDCIIISMSDALRVLHMLKQFRGSIKEVKELHILYKWIDVCCKFQRYFVFDAPNDLVPLAFDMFLNLVYKAAEYIEDFDLSTVVDTARFSFTPKYMYYHQDISHDSFPKMKEYLSGNSKYVAIPFEMRDPSDPRKIINLADIMDKVLEHKVESSSQEDKNAFSDFMLDVDIYNSCSRLCYLDEENDD